MTPSPLTVLAGRYHSLAKASEGRQLSRPDLLGLAEDQQEHGFPHQAGGRLS